MEAFSPIALLIIAALCFCGVLYGVLLLLQPRNPNPAKATTYECGAPLEGSARQPFKSRFYLIAVLFLLFDIEGVFFFPWALVYRESLAQGAGLLIAMALYLVFMLLALVYVFRKNVLELY